MPNLNNIFPLRRIVVILVLISVLSLLALGTLVGEQSDGAVVGGYLDVVSPAGSGNSVVAQDLGLADAYGAEGKWGGDQLMATSMVANEPRMKSRVEAGNVQPLSDPLAEMTTLLESISDSPESAHILELRRRLESGHETVASRVRENAMDMAIRSVREAGLLSTLVACRDQVCEMQVARRYMSGSGAIGSVGGVLNAVDRELTLHGMIRVSQTVTSSRQGAFTVTYWLPVNEVGRKLIRSP